jgi:hypothetical protein
VPPFIGGEGIDPIENIPYSLMERANHPVNTSDLPHTLSTAFGMSVGGSPCEMGSVGPAGDTSEGAPWLGPTAPIFSESTSLRYVA